MSAQRDPWRQTLEQRAELLAGISDDFALGYELGVHISWSDAYAAGWRDAELDMATAWARVASEVRARAGKPSVAELTARRKADHAPCPRKCRQCSRCIHSEAYWRRGGRDFLGVQGEAERARRVG